MRLNLAILSVPAVAASLALGGWLGPVGKGSATEIWYRNLAKPLFTPPPIAFASIWPILGLGLAFYGYRALNDSPSHAKRCRVSAWILLTGGLFAFPLIFFQGRRLQGASMIASSMTLIAVGGVAASWRRDPKASFALIPLVLWLSFATYLQIAIWQKNAGVE